MVTPSNTLSLIDRLLLNPAEAWPYFVELYTPLIYSFIKTRLDITTTEDLTQEVILAVWKNLEGFKYEKPGSLKFWVYRIVRHKVLEHHRRHKKDARTNLESLDTVLDGAEPFWEADHRKHCLQRSLERTKSYFDSNEIWMAFEEVFLKGRSAQEAAKALNTTVKVIYSRCHRVKQHFRQELDAFSD